MAGNAIAWKKEYVEAPALQHTGMLLEVRELFNALRLLIAADRIEGREQAKFPSRR